MPEEYAAIESAPVASKETASESPRSEARRKVVAKWCKRIKASKKHWEADFKRMRKNMEFTAGIQWDSQMTIDDPKYVANLTIRMVNQKVSQLYARNPKAIANRHPRMDFSVWDEKIESLEQAFMSAMTNPQDMESRAILLDYQHGIEAQKLMEKVARTMELLYDWNIRKQQPTYKSQMKQLVTRTVVAGVGFVRLSFSRDYDSPLADNEKSNTLIDRLRAARQLMSEMDENEVDESDPRVENLKMLVNSVGGSLEQGNPTDITERLVFDFPPVTSVIIDKRCRCLQGFVGAKFVAQEYILPLSMISAFFEKKVTLKKGGTESGATEYSANGEAKDDGTGSVEEDDCKEPMGCVWEVFDHATKSVFFVCDGYEDYLQEPEAPSEIQNFWPLFPLVFNRIEVEEGLKASIYPPSDVQLMKGAQKEWNKAREELTHHREANRPFYGASKGILSEEDKKKIASHVPHEVVELENVPPGTKLNEVVTAFQHAAIDPALYQTAQSQEDILMTTGSQSADLGPLSGASATEATISEQSKMSTTSSNVDDLDDALSEIAKAGGEMLLRNASVSTVKRIVGNGAVWPELDSDRNELIECLFLDIKAASSGRPNKALDVATFERLAPVLVQAGVNPHFIVREGVKRLDDQLNIADAFPLVPPQAMGAMAKPAAGVGQAASGKTRGQQQQKPGQENAPQAGAVV